MKQIRKKALESLRSILPVSAIVILLTTFLVPIHNGVMTLFLFGTLFLILGMAFFNIGAEMTMQPLGEGIGVTVSRGKKTWLGLLACFLLGTVITIAEPDLQVLAEQIPGIPNLLLILCVAVGVGFFLMLAFLRVRRSWRLSRILLISYPLMMVLAFLIPSEFLPAAFDSGGVTTGPITVPFIMALGAGIASTRSDGHTGEESFGLIALCSIGPILSVMLLSVVYRPSAAAAQSIITEVITTTEAFSLFLSSLPGFCKEVALAVSPIVVLFILFEYFFRRFHLQQLLRMSVGFLYLYAGLVFFLTGANVGFMPLGQLLGAGLAKLDTPWLLLPAGVLLGYFIVSAEPAVHVLKKQVEEISNGAISQHSVSLALAIGVGASVGISMLRVLTGISLLPFLLGGYAIALAISFFVPGLYTGVAFDSGGVASGPMTTTFILPFAMGACETLGGNLMSDAFGVVAMIAMTPLITIQVLGLVGVLRRRSAHRRFNDEFSRIPDTVLYFDEEEPA